MREELAAHEASGDDSRGMHGPAAPSAPEDTAPSLATTHAEQVLASAMNRRVWTDADAAALRSQFHAMSGEEQAEVLRQFSQAVNQGRLTVESDQIPF